MTIQKIYPHMLIVLSLIGLLASAILMNDTYKIAINPGVELPCNINPLISCTSIATKWQSSVFGFPNPILGIISFSLLFGVALALTYHVIPDEKRHGVISSQKKYFWTLVNYGSLASFIFVIWFYYESLYSIGNLCLYCMIVWIVTWPIFLYTTIWNIKEKHFSLNRIHKKFDDFLFKYHPQILVIVYLIAIFLILFRFKDFFFATL